MGHKAKTPKGEISKTNCKNRIRLRWRYAGERFSLNMPHAYLPENIHYATIKVAEIKLDIAKGCFDATLEKYNPTPPPVKPRKTAMPLPAIQERPARVLLNELVLPFNDWVRNIRNVDVDNTIYYLSVRRLLQKWAGVQIADIPQKLYSEKLAACTYNDRLTVLRSFFIWLMDAGLIDKNPMKEVRRRRNRNKGKIKNPRRMPLTDQQIADFLQAIREDTYCPHASNFKHSYYYPFLLFLFSTGVRNAEAIGLRVKHVDIANKLVEISETFARTLKGTNHAARIQKGTKTDKSRWLSLSDELVELLGKQIAEKQPNDFVFPSPRGLSIDDRMLKRRVFKPVLIKLGLGDRDPYAARHSFGTRAVQQGHPLTDVAYWMGHSTIETAVRNYVTVTPTKAKIPSLNGNKK